MEKANKLNSWKFNSNNKKHLQLLNFIVRWKFVDIDMLKQYYKVSQPALVQLMKIFIKAGFIIQKYVSNTNNKGGKKSVYFATSKACHILNKSYLNRLNFVNAPNDRIVLTKLEHNKLCLDLINKLGLKDNQYLTEIEIISRYIQVKDTLNMTSRPRICDFAYFNFDNKLIGVEVERFMKSKEKYISPDFKSQLALTSNINEYDYISKPMVSHWGYFNKEYNSWIYEPKFDGKDPSFVAKEQHNWGSVKFEPIKNYVIILDNGSEDYIWATSLKEAKQLYKSKLASDTTILEFKLVKTDDCIFKRIYYSISKQFYYQVHWYLPRNEFNRFRIFLVGSSHTKNKPIYPTGLPKYIKIFDYDSVSRKIGFYPDNLKDEHMREKLILKAKNLSNTRKIEKFNKMLELNKDENAYALFYILHKLL